MKALLILLLILVVFTIFSKAQSNLSTSNHQVKHPDWTKSAVIYEVNVRQYTAEGTFNAFAKHLDRLKEMGVDILWLMPINPIGKEKRKGSLGSYYSISDYKGINPEYGNLDDFKNLIIKAHSLGIHVIIDWVANHSAWDHPWITEHPEWYKKNAEGTFLSPYDWTDVVSLNFDNQQMRKEMINCMKYWITETNIDGFRCDVAGLVPVDFWDETRIELDKIKPVFMLAEAEEPKHHLKAFDMSYTWELHHLMNNIAQEKDSASKLLQYYKKEGTLYSTSDYRMIFTSNHDENSWNGTEFERMGNGAQTFAALSATLPGMLLIYSGQEAALNKRLKFFDKDQISWDTVPFLNFYKDLISLKHQNQALWNGNFGGTFKIITSSNPKEVLVFSRTKADNSVLVICNLSKNEITSSIPLNNLKGVYQNYFTKEKLEISKNATFKLKPWEYLIFTK